MSAYSRAEYTEELTQYLRWMKSKGFTANGPWPHAWKDPDDAQRCLAWNKKLQVMEIALALDTIEVIHINIQCERIVAHAA